MGKNSRLIVAPPEQTNREHRHGDDNISVGNKRTTRGVQPKNNEGR
jgi:hypothetical protein